MRHAKTQGYQFSFKRDGSQPTLQDIPIAFKDPHFLKTLVDEKVSEELEERGGDVSRIRNARVSRAR